MSGPYTGIMILSALFSSMLLCPFGLRTRPCSHPRLYYPLRKHRRFTPLVSSYSVALTHLSRKVEVFAWSGPRPQWLYTVRRDPRLLPFLLVLPSGGFSLALFTGLILPECEGPRSHVWSIHRGVVSPCTSRHSQMTEWDLVWAVGLGIGSVVSQRGYGDRHDLVTASTVLGVVPPSSAIMIPHGAR